MVFRGQGVINSMVDMEKLGRTLKYMLKVRELNLACVDSALLSPFEETMSFDRPNVDVLPLCSMCGICVFPG
jgi:hypothetical protein